MSAGRILLIGQAPGPNTDPARPLWPEPASSTGGRLVAFAGISPGVYLEQFDRVNLLNTFPGRTRQCPDTFPTRDARIAASAMRPFLRGRRVVLVGRAVATAFSLGLLPFHEWVSDDFEVAVIPHPSGRNAWYRRAENVATYRAFWRGIGEYPRP